MGFKEVSDVFQYEQVSAKMKNQFIFIVEDTISEYQQRYNNEFAEMKKAFGINVYFTGSVFNKVVHEEFLKCANQESIYFFELVIDNLINKHPIYDDEFEVFIKSINKLFFENSFGYEFVQGRLIRIDSKFIHQEVIMNAIQLLYEVEFESASNEYLQAFEDYKNGNLKGAITNAGKAFESTMKIICEEMNYSYKQGDSAKKLISILMDKGFIPSYLQTHFSGFNNTLESGLPTVRNKYSHGDGAVEVEVTEKIVQYALNLCATNIVFLVETFKEYITNK